MSDEEYERKIKKQILPPVSPFKGGLEGFQKSLSDAKEKASNLWDAKEVDKDSFEKDGIVYVVG